MKLISFIITFLLGLALGMYLNIKGCTSTPQIKFITTAEYKFRDSVRYEKVPEPYAIVKFKTKIDSVILEKFVQNYKIDSIYVDTSYNMILNQYQDSIQGENYKLKYKAETLGYLTNFESEVVIDRDSTVKEVTKILKPKFCAQVGISNLLEPKIGLGYKGWILEANFYPIDKPKFKQLFITKQFTF